MSFYFIWKLSMQKLSFIQANVSIRNISQKIRNKQTYKTGQNLKSNIPRPSQECISSGFLKQRIDNCHRIKIFNLSEKNTFLRFLHEDADKVTKQTRDKHKGLNPCRFVNYYQEVNLWQTLFFKLYLPFSRQVIPTQ